MAIKPDPKVPGTFIVSYAKRDPISKQPVSLRRKGIRSQAEARRVLAELVIQVEDRLRRAQVPTWRAVVDSYLRSLADRDLTPMTIHGYQTCLYRHTMPSWEDRLIDSITTQEVRELMQEKLGTRAQSHQKYFLKCIRAVFAFALESGHINRNPTPMLKFKLGDKIKMVLTEEQAKRFITAARGMSDWYPHWAMALYTGMRNGELYALTWDKVNLENRTIKVDSSWNIMNGFKSTKSGDDRIIEIAPPLVPLLRELKIEAGGEGFVLPRCERWDRGRQAHDLRMFLAGMGLPQIRFHDLRATWATILLSKGVEPIKVMKMGGWKDMETMMIYARKAGVDIRGATDCLDLHSHSAQGAKVLKMEVGSES